MFKPPKPTENLEYIIRELEELESLTASSVNLEKSKSELSKDIYNYIFRLIRNQAVLLRINMIQSDTWKETEFLRRLALLIEKMNKNIEYLS